MRQARPIQQQPRPPLSLNRPSLFTCKSRRWPWLCTLLKSSRQRRKILPQTKTKWKMTSLPNQMKWRISQMRSQYRWMTTASPTTLLRQVLQHQGAPRQKYNKWAVSRKVCFKSPKMTTSSGKENSNRLRRLSCTLYQTSWLRSSRLSISTRKSSMS